MSSTPEEPTTEPATGGAEPTSVGEIIVGGEPAAAEETRTLDGKEVAPLREKYPTRGNGWILLGVGLFIVAIMLAFADVTVSKRPNTITQEQRCGTWVDRQEPEDKDWIGACDNAQGQRTWMVAGPVVLGLASIGYGVTLRTRRKK